MAGLAEQVFAWLVRRRERAYQEGRLGVARLPRPVISIGNLRVGGSGKTPTVIALGRELQRRGLRFDVLSRGYRRAHRGLAIASTGREEVAVVGDEPRLIARSLQAPVLVHPDRFRAGLEGERRFDSQLHLLDDGFQHRQLYRQCDLVLLAADDLDGRLLPAGRLREPPTALARAHALLWTGDEATLAAARPRLAQWSPAPVFLARKRPLPLVAGGPGTTPGKLFAFCGLARPESFWATLQEQAIVPVGRRAFADHHAYSPRDLERLRGAARAAGAEGFVTTAKDAMHLADGALQPLYVQEIVMEIPEITALVDMAWEQCRR